MGADMFDTTETYTLISVHEYIAIHALISLVIGFPLKKGAAHVR